VPALRMFAITELDMAVTWPGYETLTVAAMTDGALHGIVSTTDFAGALNTAQELRSQAQQRAAAHAAVREQPPADGERSELAELFREAAWHASESSVLSLAQLHAVALQLAAPLQGVACVHRTEGPSHASDPSCSDDDLRPTAIVLYSARRTDAPRELLSLYVARGCSNARRAAAALPLP
jgi:hypothetical protein